MISECCWNEKFGFLYKISLDNVLSEQLLISKLMLSNLFKRVFLIFTKLRQCRKNFVVDSTSRLHEHRGFMESSKLWLNIYSLGWLSPSLKRVSSFNPKALQGIGLPILNSKFNYEVVVSKAFLGRMLLSILITPIPLFTLDIILFIWWLKFNFSSRHKGNVFLMDSFFATGMALKVKGMWLTLSVF